MNKDKFLTNKDYQYSIKMEPVYDAYYKKVYGVTTNIHRERGTELDKNYHVDTHLTLPNGQLLTIQEKCLRAENYDYNTCTIEFYQDRFNKVPGEFFHLASQIYFHSYGNKLENGFDRYYVIDWVRFCLWINKWQSLDYLIKHYLVPDTYGSNAAFLAIPYTAIPTDAGLYLDYDAGRPVQTQAEQDEVRRKRMAIIYDQMELSKVISDKGKEEVPVGRS